MIPLCNGFYLFPLSRAVNSNSLIFDPSEFKLAYMIHLSEHVKLAALIHNSQLSNVMDSILIWKKL